MTHEEWKATYMCIAPKGEGDAKEAAIPVSMCSWAEGGERWLRSVGILGGNAPEDTNHG